MVKKLCLKKSTNTWKGNDKENARFLLSYNKNVIMFTVANQKAIAFYFHHSMVEHAMTFKAHTEGVYFIWNRIQSELWPYLNTQQILICMLSSVCFAAYLCERVQIFLLVNRQRQNLFLCVYLNKDVTQREKAPEYLEIRRQPAHTVCLWSNFDVIAEWHMSLLFFEKV